MRKSKLITLIPILVTCSFLSAQIVVDFTSAEGYVDGDLGGSTGENANSNDWVAGSPAGWQVDSTGSGTVTLPALSYNRATYSGAGSTLTGNNYTSINNFTLDYTADIDGSLQEPAQFANFLGRFDFGGDSKSAGAGLQQRGSGAGDGVYRIALFYNILGTNQTIVSDTFTASDLGLSTGTLGWDDAISDLLQIEHSLVYAAGSWTQTMTLTNVTTSAEVATLSTTYSDTISNFLTGDNSYYISSAQLVNLAELTMGVDSVTVAVPEPGTFALFAGFIALGAVQIRRRRRS